MLDLAVGDFLQFANDSLSFLGTVQTVARQTYSDLLQCILFMSNDRHSIYIAPVCLERLHYVKGKDEALGPVEVDVGCHEERIVS